MATNGAKRGGKLRGKVAVVAGATRGAGRGIALALGEQGATVYCTGRSSRRGRTPKGRPETIEETAEMVEARGGTGIPVRCDHLQPTQVRRLFARVQREAGRLDVLVNDIWGGDPLTEWGKPFWELSLEKGLAMIEGAIHTHLVTSRHGVPLMLKARRGLVVEITDGDGALYRGNLFYDHVKLGVIRLAFAMAEELRPRGIASLAVTPGFLRSEAMLDHFGVSEANWRDAGKKQPHFLASETPLFVGRAVAALAADPRVLEKSGRVHSSWDLSDEYGFEDADGSRPHWGRHFAEAFGPIYKRLDDRYYSYWAGYATLKAAMEKERTPT